MELVGVKENSITLGKREKFVVYMTGHFSFKHDNKFKFWVPMAIYGISMKAGKPLDYRTYRQIE
jgi:hypothetical protein